MKSSRQDLGKGSVPRLVLGLAVPAMIAQFVNVLYSLIDRVYIGNIPGVGDLALAGVGVCGPIVTLLSSFGTLVGLGGSILMAIRMGEGNNAAARKVLANCFLMLVGLSALLTAGFLICREPLLRCFGASDATFAYADTYLTIYTAGTFFALMAVGLNYFITCQGYSTVGMAAVLIGAVANIILDPVFIFALNMGVAGAAAATVLSQFLSCAFTAWFLFCKPPIRIGLCRPDFPLMFRVAGMGFPPFLILATDSIILIAMNAVLQYYGGPEQGDALIACATIVQSCMALITGPMLGISSGTQAILSYNYGACRSDRVRQAARCVLRMCLGFTVIMFVVFQLLAGQIVRIFTSDASLLELSAWGLRVFTLGIIPLAVQYARVDGLTALARTRTSLALSLFRKVGFVLLTLALPAFFGARAAFYAEPLADVISACVSGTVFVLVFEPQLVRREFHAAEQLSRED